MTQCQDLLPGLRAQGWGRDTAHGPLCSGDMRTMPGGQTCEECMWETMGREWGGMAPTCTAEGGCVSVAWDSGLVLAQCVLCALPPTIAQSPSGPCSSPIAH